jgi:hypothetical protein
VLNLLKRKGQRSGAERTKVTEDKTSSFRESEPLKINVKLFKYLSFKRIFFSSKKEKKQQKTHLALA